MEAARRLHRALLTTAALGTVLGPALAVCADPPASRIAVETLDGTTTRPFTTATRAWVFVFTRTDCPIAARYAPELQRLAQRAQSSHVAFHLVFVDPAETPTTVRAYLHDYGYGDVALRDPEHRLVQLASATTTPEAAVFVPSQSGPVLAYRGRIDDRYVDVAHTRPAATRHDLEDVLAAIAQGHPPALRTTPAVGCLIADVAR